MCVAVKPIGRSLRLRQFLAVIAVQGQVVHTHRVHIDLAWPSRSCIIFAGNSDRPVALPVQLAFMVQLGLAVGGRNGGIGSIMAGCRTGHRWRPGLAAR
jgi:hypothetical protein